MGNIGLKVMFGIRKFVASQAVNFVRTLVSRFSTYIWSWRVEAVGKVIGTKSKWKEEEATLNLGKG